jgi:hypothetical protein
LGRFLQDKACINPDKSAQFNGFGHYGNNDRGQIGGKTARKNRYFSAPDLLRNEEHGLQLK